MGQEWETEITEFKQEFTTDIRKTIVAFANDYSESGGGIIVIGIDPNTHSIIDLSEDTDKIMQRISGLCRDGNITPTLAPQIYPLNIDSKTIIIIEIKCSERRPHRANNMCYIRLGSTTRRASPDEEFELIRRTGHYPYDLLPVRDATIKDLNFTKFEYDFLSKRVSPEMLLDNGRSIVEWAEHLKFLLREGDELRPTVAAILLFGKDPQYFFSHTSIDFIRFDGNDPSYTIINRKEIRGTIDELIRKAVEIIEISMLRSYQFSDTSPAHTNIWEYPLRAAREAIINAVIHRDYEITSISITIKMFNNRLEIFNPGGLYGLVTKENFGTGSNDYRNKTLANNLAFFDFIERAGTGISLIRRLMKENGSQEPIFDINNRYLIVKLPAHLFYLAKQHYDEGLLAFEQGNLEEARIFFDKALKNNPKLEEVYLELSKLEEQEGNLDKSQEILKQGMEILPRSKTLHTAWNNSISIWEIDPLTEAMHQILKNYLNAWLPIMIKQYDEIGYIDAFAGPGEYIGNISGSPTIFFETLLKHISNSSKIKKLTVVCIFIEKEFKRYKHLVNVLEQYKLTMPTNIKIEIVHNSPKEYLMNFNRPIPLFVFLNPFGIKDIPLTLIKKIMSNSSREVLINFAYNQFNRFAFIKPELTTSFMGTNEWMQLNNIKDSKERKKFILELYIKQLKSEVNAKYVLPFTMYDKNNRCKYFLFFCTNNKESLIAMENVMCTIDPSSNYEYHYMKDNNQLSIFN